MLNDIGDNITATCDGRISVSVALNCSYLCFSLRRTSKVLMLKPLFYLLTLLWVFFLMLSTLQSMQNQGKRRSHGYPVAFLWI